LGCSTRNSSLDDGHQRGQVLGDGEREQRLHTAVEVGAAHAEQVEDVVADLDAAGVHREGERVGAGLVGHRVTRRHAPGQDVGDGFQTRPVLVPEALGALGDGDETAPAGVPRHGQDAEAPGALGFGHALGACGPGEPGEVLGAEPGGASGAVGPGDRGRVRRVVGHVVVAQAVERPRQPRGLGQAEPAGIAAGEVQGGERGPREDERLFEDPVPPLG
jgi:hypothetical protein